MKEDVKQFLESSLLEEYVLGIIDPEQVPEVEKYIRESREVQSVYNDLQEQMELLAKKAGIPPPPGTKEAIIVEIDRTHPIVKKPLNYHRWWSVAATLAALVLSVWLLQLNTQQASLKRDMAKLGSEFAALQNKYEQQQLQEQQWKVLAGVDMEKYRLSGNEKAPELELVAYWNEEVQASFLHLLSTPELPKGKCLQLWADVDGEMISVDILPKEPGQIVSIPFKKDATSLNITIEPEGGSEHPTVADLVANVAI